MGDCEGCEVREDFVMYGLIGGEYYEVRVIGPGREGQKNVRILVLEGPYKAKQGYIESYRLLFQDGLFDRSSPKGKEFGK